MIKVAIADDHHLFSGGLKDALNAVPDITVVGVAGDADEGLMLLQNQAVDVLLLDWEMPNGGGAAVLARRPKPPVIVVTMHSEPRTRDAAVAAGAAGVLSKSTRLPDLAAAIRLVATGDSLPQTDAELARALQLHSTARLDPGAESLTEREKELLTLLASGVSSTEDLADRLYISQKTVKNHLASIFQKLSVSDRTQAAIEAIRLGLGGRQ